jgi:intracellular septation protein
MKAFIDFIPVIAFFVAFKLGDIFTATLAGIVSTAAVVAYLKLTKQKVQPFLWLGLIIITVFGGLTLFFHDESFIKWKPTVLYLVAATALTVGLYGFKKNLLRWLLGQQLEMPPRVWDVLSNAWSLFFGSLGLINAYVVLNYTTEQWVYWRTWIITGAIFAFAIGVAVYISKHVKLPDENIASDANK